MPLPVAVSVVSVAGFAIIFVILVQPLIFSDVHVSGRVGADVNVVFPEIFTLVTLVPTSAKVVSPVGKVGSVVSDVQPDKFRLKVPVGNPAIVVIPAPAIVNAVGKPVHPVRFSVVHVVGRVGTDVSPVTPVRSTLVSLVQADKFRSLTDDGNPVSEVIFGGANNVLTVDGILGSVVNLEQAYKSRANSDDGNPVSEVIFGGAVN